MTLGIFGFFVFFTFLALIFTEKEKTRQAIFAYSRSGNFSDTQKILKTNL